MSQRIDNKFQIQLELEHHVYDAMTQSCVVNILLGLVVAYLLWPVVDTQSISIWLGAVAGFNVLRYIDFVLYSKSIRLAAFSNTQCIYTGTLLSALSWASLSILFFDVNETRTVIVTILVLAGLAAGSVTSLSPFPMLARLYNIFLIGPLLILFLYQDNHFYQSLSIPAILFIASNISNINRHFRKLFDNIRLRIQSERSSEKIEQQKDLLNQTGEIGLIGGWVYNRENDKFIWTQQTYKLLSIPSFEKPDVDTLLVNFPLQKKRIFLNYFKDSLDNGTSFSMEFSLKNSFPEKWLKIIGQASVRDGQTIEIHGSVQDITASKTYETEINQHKQRLQKVLSTANYGEFNFSIKDDEFYFDKTALQIQGLTEDRAYCYKCFEKFMHPDDAANLYVIFKEKINTESDISTQYRINLPSGKVRYIEMHAFVETNPLNKTKNIHGLLADITSFKESENFLREANKKAEAAATAKSQFLANMSHEIRTPMNGIIGTLQLLKKTRLTKKQMAHINTATYSADSLLHIINDILDLAKIESGKLEVEQHPLNLGSLIVHHEHMLQTQTSKKNLSYTINKDKNLAEYIISDKHRINQVITNLISNAIKFTPEGNIELNVALQASSVSPMIRFEVLDTGVGIDNAVINKLFDEFEQADISTTRKFGGTGLGLSICKKLIELMNGEIGVDSKLGEGSCFWFEVPYVIADNESENDEVSKEELELTFDGRVLLVEDNEINQIISSEMLRSKGLFVDVAENGEVAVKLLKHKQYDLIFMDCQMPVMDGYEATHQIRSFEEHQQTRPSNIVALTANVLPEDRRKCIDAGMNDYLGKPFTEHALVSILKKWLSMPPQEDTGQTTTHNTKKKIV